MDQYTRNALRDYWKREDDEEVITDNELSNPRNDNLIEENEIAQIFRIDTAIFHLETPLCEAFKEFNYLTQIDVDPWNDDEVWTELINNICHECNLLHFKNETAKWTTCNWKEDGYCNTGELPDSFEKAIQFAIKTMNEGESSNDAWSHDSPIDEWKDYEHTTYNNVCQIGMDRNKTRDNKGWFDEHKLMKDVDDDINDLKDYLIQKDPPYQVNEEEEKYKERRCKQLGIPYVKPTCKSEKFEVVIYSFRPEEEYVAIKEYEYDIWVRTEENMSHVYQDIFHKKDEGWSVTRTK
ncbi:hypothetical protein Tco_1045825 [Tanacetum coccineum]|uniref:Uncharacterized protein n=1 Tax=Tanacetum coccineum TaxID=301880 RepID=A0ABQ5GTZ7_9ASTR